MKNTQLQTKIKTLVEKSTSNLFERDEIVKLAFLALLGGESIFLMGPPGVAKSLVARQMKYAVKDATSFEYLMNRFSTPEEIFGPISLKKLDEDKYERKVENYLPSVEIAFLDEIWKASPSIQNTLLTIINEKIFRNGSEDINVPLQLLIAASNELPAVGEGLEALYDRFLIRKYVDNIQDKELFGKLITSERDVKNIVTDSEKISIEEIKNAKSEIESVKVDQEVIDFIIELKNKLNAQLKDSAPYVSDRRWKKIVWLLKTSAYVSGREKIESADLLLIQDLIWETMDQEKQIRRVFTSVWEDFVVQKVGFKLTDITNKISELEKRFDNAFTDTTKISQRTLKDYDGSDQIFYIFDWSSQGSEYKYFALPVEEYDDGVFRPYISSSRYSKYYYKANNNDAWRSYNYQSNYFTYDDSKSEYRYNNNLLSLRSSGERKVDKGEIEKIKIELATTSKLLSKLDDKIDAITSGLESISAPLVHSYGYEIKKLNGQLHKSLETYSKERNTLLGKIESAK